MSDGDAEPGQKFWKGQNIFVVLFGGGVVVVPEHHVYGSTLMVLGAIGFARSIWSKTMRKQDAVWIATILLTWVGIGYDYYDRHHATPEMPEFDEPQNWPYAEYGHTPYDCYLNANGDFFYKYRDVYRIAMACAIDDGTVDRLDIKNIQVSNAFDIVHGMIGMRVTVSENIRPLLSGGTGYFILLIPKNISIAQFTTFRAARLSGVKIKLAGGIPGPVRR